jgi:hypothetical protein
VGPNPLKPLNKEKFRKSQPEGWIHSTKIHSTRSRFSSKKLPATKRRRRQTHRWKRAWTHQGPSQRSFGGGNTSTAAPGTNRTQDFSKMQRQTKNGADSQQLQQQQQQQQRSDAARNQLLSLALSGDVAKALQFANFAGLQHQGSNRGLDLTGNNGSGGMGPNGGGNQQLFQDRQRSSNPSQSLGLGQSQSHQELYTDSAGWPQHQTSNNSSLQFAEVGALDSTEPEVKKPVHPVVVPCRARGMEKEHNFQVR